MPSSNYKPNTTVSRREGATHNQLQELCAGKDVFKLIAATARRPGTILTLLLTIYITYMLRTAALGDCHTKRDELFALHLLPGEHGFQTIKMTDRSHAHKWQVLQTDSIAQISNITFYSTNGATR